MSETIQKKNLILYRSYDEKNDQNHILHTWLHGLRTDNEWFRKITKEAYFQHYELFLKRILTDPKTSIKVACLKEDPTVILGYAVLKQLESGYALHWVYVKKIWRRIGIMKDLRRRFKIRAFTHLTRLMDSIRVKEKRQLPFNPFL